MSHFPNFGSTRLNKFAKSSWITHGIIRPLEQSLWGGDWELSLFYKFLSDQWLLPVFVSKFNWYDSILRVTRMRSNLTIELSLPNIQLIHCKGARGEVNVIDTITISVDGSLGIYDSNAMPLYAFQLQTRQRLRGTFVRFYD